MKEKKYKIQLQVLEEDECCNYYHITALFEKEITEEEFHKLYKEMK